MGVKRDLIESALRIAAARTKNEPVTPRAPRNIFVLRPNDIGDLIVITPLFEALARRFPEARIIAGVGRWNVDVLKNNPFVSEVLVMNAPWHNKNCCKYPHNSLRGMAHSFRYIFRDPEVKQLARRQCEIGIDILGSPEGALLLMRSGIPHRLGVKGYAGGHSAAHKCVDFNDGEYVGRAALRFAELLGLEQLPEARPQLYPIDEERYDGEALWRAGEDGRRRLRVVVAPGGGFAEKCWPASHYAALLPLLASHQVSQFVIVGGRQDQEVGTRLAQCAAGTRNFAGELTLRQTFATVATADLVLCNASMMMHAAAAFSKPTLVLLGEWFTSRSAHWAQWGYGASSIHVGKDEGRNEIYSPQEVLDVIRREFLAHAAAQGSAREPSLYRRQT